jgi:hypothetical protein
LHQASDMQAVRRGIKSDVCGNDSGASGLIERRSVGLLMDVPALVERAQKFGFKFGHLYVG